MDLQKRVVNAVDPGRVMELLIRMIRTPSPNYGDTPLSERSEEQMARLVAEYGRQLGLEVTVEEVLPGRPNVVCSLPGQATSRRLAFCAHMDTVPPSSSNHPDPSAQLDPHVVGNKIYGRGSCDTKGSLAAMLTALRVLKELGEEDPAFLPPCTVTLVATVDEEHGLHGVYHLLDAGFGADGVIVGEPTGLDIMLAHGGCVRWRVNTRGRSAHSSRPSEGINAIYAMARVIDFFQAEAEKTCLQIGHHLVGPPALTVAMISGGTKINVVPEKCTIEVDRRTIPGEDPAQIWEQIRDELMLIEGNIHPARLDVEPPYIIDYAMDTSPDLPLVRCLRDTVQLYRGECKYTGAAYGTEASKFSRAGIPAVVFGPGDIRVAHSANEYVDLEEVLMAARILVHVALKFGS